MILIFIIDKIETISWTVFWDKTECEKAKRNRQYTKWTTPADANHNDKKFPIIWAISKLDLFQKKKKEIERMNNKIVVRFLKQIFLANASELEYENFFKNIFHI